MNSSYSTLSAFAVKPAASMAGFDVVRPIPEREARQILHRVAEGELQHFKVDEKQADPRNPRFTTKRGYRTGPVSVLAVETEPGVVVCIWFIGTNWRNPLSADVVWAEELRRPGLT